MSWEELRPALNSQPTEIEEIWVLAIDIWGGSVEAIFVEIRLVEEDVCFDPAWGRCGGGFLEKFSAPEVAGLYLQPALVRSFLINGVCLLYFRWECSWREGWSDEVGE